MVYPNEAIVRNVLVVLFSKKSLLPEEQKLFSILCRELGLSKEDYVRIGSERQKRPGELLQGANREENLLILSFMVAGAYFDNMVYSGERETLLRFCAVANLPRAPLERLLARAWTFDFPDGVVDDMLEIRAWLLENGEAADQPGELPAAQSPAGGAGSGIVRLSAAGGSERRPDRIAGYVATQVSPEGLDELQGLFICAQLGLNAALSGPPGIGKTESVLELAKILEIPLFTKTCSSRTTESHIISHPILMERNGVSVTAHEDGALCRAMLGPGLFYGDEYNLLKEDVQKRMNSAFDDRREIDRNDGSAVRAKPGFMAVISYNPTQDFGRRDLEDSVADRFVHFRFRDWPSDLRAYISALKADRETPPPFSDFKVDLGVRGIGRSGSFCVQKAGEWFDFFTGARVEQPRYRYLCLAAPSLSSEGTETKAARSKLDAQAFPYVELARTWSKYVEDVNQLAETGRSWLLEELGLGDKAAAEDYETMSVHRASTRIIAAALAHHRWLADRGASPYLAQSYGTRLIINQMSYGAFGDFKLRDRRNLEVLEGIARAFRLYLNDTVFRTDVAPSKSGAGPVEGGKPAGSKGSTSGARAAAAPGKDSAEVASSRQAGRPGSSNRK